MWARVHRPQQRMARPQPLHRTRFRNLSDSLVMHADMSPAQNVLPERVSAWRHVVYCCMQPAALATPGDLARKREAWDGFRVTTHWPAFNVEVFPDDGACDPPAFTYSLPCPCCVFHSRLLTWGLLLRSDPNPKALSYDTLRVRQKLFRVRLGVRLEVRLARAQCWRSSRTTAHVKTPLAVGSLRAPGARLLPC